MDLQTRPTSLHRQILHHIELHCRSGLQEGGHRYKLLAAVDLAGLANRDGYEVLSRTEAERVLDELAKHATPDLAAYLMKARGVLSPDRNEPSFPIGLICLRRIPVHVTASTNQETPITPSQMRAVMEAHAKDVVYDEQIQIIDQTTGEPLAKQPYVILQDDEVMARGRTDDNGMTARVRSGNSEAPMTLLWGDEALAWS